ncbi:hypothetical protein L6164_024699 [Bauhinia variegata]|uniref:Uncharacterized protein n=1 Tax=Bauhinia variegata TaxID=167791 RepID=A0ACB9LZK0_BAUVA|nr:hypothetical protein L6164_024699 [Bauhinia variegata]
MVPIFSIVGSPSRLPLLVTFSFSRLFHASSASFQDIHPCKRGLRGSFPCHFEKIMDLRESIGNQTDVGLSITKHAAIAQVDFQTKAAEVCQEVNSWAEKETSGLIKEVLPAGSVDCSTRLIFANALYFKGAWNDKFDASQTEDYDFYLLSGGSVKVPFMTSEKKQFISAFDGFKVLALPYKQGEDKRRFSMYFFLPDAEDGLPALVDKVGSESGFLERHIPNQKVDVGDFRIPRFKISFGCEISNVLKELGVVLPFSGGDLTEIVDSPVGQNLYVSSIFHKSFIEVNEESTEAAAATATTMLLSSLQFETGVDFVADHPFLFLIREDMTGTVVFVGHVLNPLAA